MLDLERHIEILLLNNDCVIVPDFGGFMAHHIEAKIDDGDKHYLPPKRTLGFNPQLIVNDSLLVQSYIEAYDISYPEALRKIADEVSELRQHLNNDGKYELNDLGTITLTAEGKYSFEPCEAGLLTPELYGLSSFDVKELEQPIPQIEMSTIAIAKEHGNAVQPSRESATAEIDDTEENRNTINIKVSLLRNVAAIALALILFAVLSPHIGNPDPLSMMNGKVDTGLLLRILPKDITKGTPTAKDVRLTKHAPAKTLAMQQDSLTKSTEKSFYTVVLCCRVTKKNAEAYAKNLKSKGLNDIQVLNQKHDVKVVFGQYDTKEQAYGVAAKLSKNEQFKDCWVAKIHS